MVTVLFVKASLAILLSGVSMKGTFCTDCQEKYAHEQHQSHCWCYTQGPDNMKVSKHASDMSLRNSPGVQEAWASAEPQQ